MVSGGQCDDHTVVNVTHGDTGLTRHNTEVQSGVRLTSDDTCQCQRQLQQRYDDEQRRHGNIVDNLQAQVITHMLTTNTTTTTTATTAATAVSFIVCVFLHASPHSEIFS